MNSAVIVAGGSGSRFGGDIPKQFYKLNGKEIKSFSIVYINYLGKKFESRVKFVSIIEQMLVEYYEGVVQYLKNWEKPAPKIHHLEE